MKSHAFLIAAHAFPEQLEDIVKMLDAPNHYFFIHIDKKNKKMLSADAILRLKEKQNISFMHPMVVNIAEFSQITSILRLFEEAYKWERGKIDYFHLISGQDYPCISNSDLDALFEYEEKSYMHFDSPEEALEWRKRNYPSRVDYFYFGDLHVPLLSYNNIIRRILIKLLNTAAKVYKREPMVHVYAGWDWFSWHRSVVEYVLAFVKDNPSYVKRFHKTSSTVEMFFHTMLYDKADQLNIEKYRSLRFIQWNPREANKLHFTSKERLLHPLILDEREYNDIINSGAIFCRKVHPVHSAKLIALLKKRVRETLTEP